jgi:peptidyl-prolyl cis-trans isomerase SurA
MRLLFLLTAVFVGIFSSAHAQRSDSIAAVVNGDVITYTDLYDRMDLVIKSARMPNTKEFKERLLPQVLTGLITEQIQLQEANRLGLETTPDEIAKGFERLAAQNKIKASQFKKMLKSQKVNISTLESQIESQLAWGKVVQREIRPRIALSDDDIDGEYKRLKAKEGQQEFFVAEIFLPVDKAASESDVRKAANDLSKQLKSDVRQFPAAARQFSQSATAANGGIIGWVTPDQLGDDLGLSLKNMKTQQVSQPVKGDDGYTILFLHDKRVISLGQGGEAEERLRLKLAVFDIPTDGSKQTIEDAVDIFRRDVKGCLDILKRVAQLDNARIDDIDDTVKNIPTQLRDAVDGVDIGSVGDSIETETTITVPMLCGRDGGGENVAVKREIENRLGTQRMDILQKRYLRDLISNAYIERRV